MESIIIADDHALVRKGLKLLLTGSLGCKDVTEAESCSALLNELKQRPYSHLILDLVLSDGISLEIIPAIRKLYPALKIMIFSMQPKEIYADAFKFHKIFFYLSKSSNEEYTVAYLRRFLSDENFPTNYSESSEVRNPFSSLASRELEVLHYVINGYKTNDIARILNISSNTVSTFKHRIFEKTGTENLSQLYEMWSIYQLGYGNNKQKLDNL